MDKLQEVEEMLGEAIKKLDAIKCGCSVKQPKTIKRWKWLFQRDEHFFISNGYWTEHEATNLYGDELISKISESEIEMEPGE